MFLQGKRANDYENGNLVKFQKTKEKRKKYKKIYFKFQLSEF